MTELQSMLEAANPVPDAGPGSDVSVPPFEDVWSAAQTPCLAGHGPRDRQEADTSSESVGRSHSQA